MERSRFTKLALLLIASSIGFSLSALKLSQYKAKDLCGSDFAVFYAGGKLVGTDQLYSSSAAQSIQTQEVGCTTPSAIFIRLPYFAAFMWPWAHLPFWTSFSLWRLANCLGVGIFIWLWPTRREWSLLACAWSMPLTYNLFNGQDVGFLLMWIALARFLLVERGALWTAGFSLSFCAAKFHLFFMIPFLFKPNLRKMAWGLASGALTLLALCFAVQGRNWPKQFLAAATDPRIDPVPEILINLRGLSHGHGAVQVLLALSVAGASLYIFRYGDFSYRLAAVITGGILLMQHQTYSDLALLIPVALILAEHALARYSKWVALVLISPPSALAMFMTPSSAEIPRILFLILPYLMAWELSARGARNLACRVPNHRDAWRAVSGIQVLLAKAQFMGRR